MQNDQIVIYKTENGETVIDMKVDDNTIWLTLNQLSELFGKNKSTISMHLNNIYTQEELTKEATVTKKATVQIEANRHIERTIEYYNLDAIISVGYRVNSKQGTAFRIWANKILKDHLSKGYSLNEKRLKEQNEQLNSLKNAVTLLEDDLIDNDGTKPTDRAYCFIYHPEKSISTTAPLCAQRSELALTVNLPHSFAGEVQLWLFFISDDLKFVSETEHLGEFTISS